jgi:urease beta subunit
MNLYKLALWQKREDLTVTLVDSYQFENVNDANTFLRKKYHDNTLTINAQSNLRFKSNSEAEIIADFYKIC